MNTQQDSEPSFHAENGILHIHWPYDIRSTNAATVKGFIFSCVENAKLNSTKWKELRLDLREAILIDSTGQNLLLQIAKMISENNKTLTVLVSHPSLHRVLILTQLESLMNIVLDVKS